MAAVLPPLYSVRDAMVAAGVDDTDIFNGQSSAARLAEDLFNDEFLSCMDKSHKDLGDDFKSFSTLTQVQGQIRLIPRVKKRIQAFVQWTRDEVRLGRDPHLTPFPVAMTSILIRRYNTHAQFIKKADTLTTAAKPAPFTKEVKWADWMPSFLNYLRTIPGRDGHPLKYICRERDQPDPTPNPDFIDDYVMMAPLNGEAYSIDSSEVFTLIVNFIAGNETAEAKIQPHVATTSGRDAFKALVAHYEGVGLHSVDIIAADEAIDSLYYTGEKKPHMWWEEFEKRLTAAFAAYDKKEGRQVFSDEMKLRILIKKVNTDFLANVKAGISIELTRATITMTYNQALQTFRNEVNTKFPLELGGRNRGRRHINELSQRGGRGGRGRGRFGGRGGGRGRGRGTKRTRNDSTFITLTDGKQIEYHPSFNFPSDIYGKMKQADRDHLKRQREEYKRQRNVQQTTQQPSANPPQQPPVAQVQTTGGTQVSQVTTGSTMMGGRNEQTPNHN